MKTNLKTPRSNNRRCHSHVVCILSIICGCIQAGVALGAPGDTELISKGPTGRAAGAGAGTVSPDGRFVAFISDATNLVAGDTNGIQYIFVLDRQSGAVERVNVATNGAQANNFCDEPAFSADGRYVAFNARASNLVPGDTNDFDDLLVYDRQKRVTERVNVDSNGVQEEAWTYNPMPPSISANGRYVAFSTYTAFAPNDDNETADVYVHDRRTGANELVSVDSNGVVSSSGGEFPSISADGRYVAFQANSRDLVPEETLPNATQYVANIFVHDRRSGVTRRVSRDFKRRLGGNEWSIWPAISGNGRFVVFASGSTNLTPEPDTNGVDDIFLFDRLTGLTKRISVASDGTQANGESSVPQISADGGRVAFRSAASNLVPNDVYGGVFVHDLATSTTTKVSIDSAGAQPGGSGYYPKMSADGRFVTFMSGDHLAPGDTDRRDDLYLHELTAAAPPLVPRLKVTPRYLDFGTQKKGSTSLEQTLTLTNVSDAPVPIFGVRLAGLHPRQFAITHNCGDSLAQAGSCTVTVVFKPFLIGDKWVFLKVNGVRDGGLRAAMTGSGRMRTCSESPLGL